VLVCRLGPARFRPRVRRRVDLSWRRLVAVLAGPGCRRRRRGLVAVVR